MGNGSGDLKLTDGVVLALTTLAKHGSMETLKDPGSRALLGPVNHRRSTRFERGCRILEIHNFVADEKPIQDPKRWSCYRLTDDGVRLLADRDRMLVVYHRHMVI